MHAFEVIIREKFSLISKVSFVAESHISTAGIFTIRCPLMPESGRPGVGVMLRGIPLP